MKTLSVTAIASAVSMIAMMGAAPSVQAYAVTNHAGQICQPYDYYNAGRVDYLSTAARLQGASAGYLICPLTRAQNTAGAVGVYVDVNNSSSATISCTLYSWRDNGGSLGSSSLSWTGSGWHEFYLTLTAAQVASWSDLAVLCYIPGNYVGKITGLDVIEY